MQEGQDRSELSRWPHIGVDELRALWEEHSPGFLRIENVERDLPRLRSTFLAWLSYKGVDLGPLQPDRLGRRIRIDGVTLTRRGAEAETSVSMSLGDIRKKSTRIGSSKTEDIIRLSAEATLENVNKLIPVVTFGLEEVYTVVPSSADFAQIAVVVVRDQEGRSSERYVGASPITASVPEAAVKASMSAVNRQAEIAAAMLGS